MVKQSRQSLGTYSLEKLKLENESIDNIDLANEITSLYSTGSKNEYDQFMTIPAFYKDKFALCIDLRSFHDNMVVDNGKKVLNTQSGLTLEVTKRIISANVRYRIFVLSDVLINFINSDLQNIQY